MSDWTRSDYLSFRRRYEPEDLELVVVAESPPASGRYFYDPAGATSEPLFAALMRQLRHSPETKDAGLRGFQRSGWILVDATYEPVNAFSASKRNMVIARDYPLLRDDLASLMRGRSIPLVLIKANICRILEPMLEQDGYNVLNRGRRVCFPSHGWQSAFQREFGAIVSVAEIDDANA